MANRDDDEIRYEIATTLHRDGILSLAKAAFVPYEPLSKSLGLTWEDDKKQWEKTVDIALHQPCSYVAVNGSGVVVGLRLSRIMDMSKYCPNDPIHEWITIGPTRSMVDRVSRQWSKALGDSKKSMQFLALCVHPDYGGRGIAVRMCEENLALAKRLGCDSCSVIGSNWMSQRVFEKVGFKTVETLDYRNFCDETGEPVFKMKDPRQTCAKFYALRLA